MIFYSCQIRTLVAMATYCFHRLIMGKLEIDISLYKSCVFYAGRIRTLVAMAIYSSHRLLMGKLEIDRFCCLAGDI